MVQTLVSRQTLGAVGLGAAAPAALPMVLDTLRSAGGLAAEGAGVGGGACATGAGIERAPLGNDSSLCFRGGSAGGGAASSGGLAASNIGWSSFAALPKPRVADASVVLCSPQTSSFAGPAAAGSAFQAISTESTKRASFGEKNEDGLPGFN